MPMPSLNHGAEIETLMYYLDHVVGQIFLDFRCHPDTGYTFLACFAESHSIDRMTGCPGQRNKR